MRRNRISALLVVLALPLLILACAKVDPFAPDVFDPSTQSGSADFSVLVSVGDSYSAGFTNGGLVEDHQVLGYSAQVARQLGKQVVSRTPSPNQPLPGEFVLAAVDNPGTPGYLALTSLDPPALEPVLPPGGAPLNLTYAAPYNDMAIAGANVTDFFTVPGGSPAFDLVLRGQGTMYQQTAALQPTFILLWLGNNDMLQKVTQDLPLTPPAVFAAAYEAVVDSLVKLPSAPKLAAVNIPSVSSIPYASTVPPFLVDPVTGQPVLSPGGTLVPLLGPDGALTLPTTNTPGDLVMVTAIPMLEQGIGIPALYGGTDQALPKTVTAGGLTRTVVLYQDEVIEINIAVSAYNQAILDAASPRGIPVANVNNLLRQGTDPGFDIGGVTYTTEFITGGLIGLDGVHPTDIGYALIGNAVIESINARYGSSIPLVSLRSFVSPTSTSVQALEPVVSVR